MLQSFAKHGHWKFQKKLQKHQETTYPGKRRRGDIKSIVSTRRMQICIMPTLSSISPSVNPFEQQCLRYCSILLVSFCHVVQSKHHREYLWSTFQLLLLNTVGISVSFLDCINTANSATKLTCLFIKICTCFYKRERFLTQLLCTTGCYKVARHAYGRLQCLQVPDSWVDKLEVATLAVRAKAGGGCEEAAHMSIDIPMCYSCSSPLPLVSQSSDDKCSVCLQPFFRSFLTFDHIPLVSKSHSHIVYLVDFLGQNVQQLISLDSSPSKNLFWIQCTFSH